MFLLPMLHVLSFGVLIEAGVKSFCTASPAKVGKDAFILCDFDTDINIVHKDVLVYVFKGNKHQHVFSLAWYDGKPNISMEPGYEWGGTISNHTIIEIPKANPDHAGEYKCFVPPNAKGDARGCKLNISGVTNYTSLTTFLTLSTTKLAEDTKGTNEDHIIAIILGVALGVVNMLLAVVAWRKRWIRFPCKREQENPTTINQADTHPLSSSKKIQKNISAKQTFDRFQRHQHNGVYKELPTCHYEEKERN